VKTADVQQILANPDDDAPRLVYADALLEAGDPRGEFIRVQVEAAALPDGDPRKLELERQAWRLRARHAARLFGGLQGRFRRGFLEDVWGEHGRIANAIGKHPLRSLLLTKAQVGLERATWFSRPARLVLEDSSFTRRLANPTFERVTELGVPADCALESIAGLERMQVLELACQVSETVLDGILRATPALRRIRVTGQAPSLITRLLAARVPELELRGNFGAAGAALLARSERLASCRRLGLRDLKLLPSSLIELIRSPHLGALEHLDLSANYVEATAMRAMADARFRRLRALRMEEMSGTGDDGMRSLAAAPFADLRSLTVTCGVVTDEGVRALGAGPWRDLAVLDLWAHQLDKGGLAALAAAPAFRKLRHLSVGFPNHWLTDLEGFLAAPWPALEVLVWRGSGMSGTKAELLLRTEHLPSLKLLLIDKHAFTDTRLEALREKFGGVFPTTIFDAPDPDTLAR
jgi:uncharacterized protein (TIGR02996 family)